jgi:hypothetical protein
MNWDTIERRWKQFLDMLHGSEENPTRDNRQMAATTRNEAVIDLQDRCDKLNDLDDTAEFGEDVLQVHRPTASNRQGIVAPAEPSERNREGDDKARQEQSPRVFIIRACVQHKSMRNSDAAASR